MSASIERSDVVVIGAGIGGLRVASLLDGGKDVVVIEARERVGGRVRSPSFGGGPLDLGATWFWPNEPRINNLLDELGLAVFAQHGSGQMVFDDGVASPRRAPNQLDTPSGRIALGFEAVAQALADQLGDGQIRFGTEATAIRRHDSGVEIETTSGSFQADDVVVALPPALAVSGIDFGEGLDEALSDVAAATPVWMGSTVKVVVTYRRPFWRDQGLAGSAFSYAGPMRELHDMSGPDGSPAAIFGFCALASDEPAPDRDVVVGQMVRLFGPEAAEPTGVNVMDWRLEPYTISPALVGLTNYQTYGHPAYQVPALGGRLHWASTETSTEAPGHVEGALAAADRAARAILARQPGNSTMENSR